MSVVEVAAQFVSAIITDAQREISLLHDAVGFFRGVVARVGLLVCGVIGCRTNKQTNKRRGDIADHRLRVGFMPQRKEAICCHIHEYRVMVSVRGCVFVFVCGGVRACVGVFVCVRARVCRCTRRKKWTALSLRLC